MAPPSVPPPTDYVKIATVVVAYFFVSIALVFSNKVLMSDSIPAPIFVTWFQCVFTAGLCWVLGVLGVGQPKGSFFSQFPPAVYVQPVAVKVMPLSLIFVFMITFNNLCLKYVEVSFYNVARSLTIVFNVIFTYFLLNTPTSWAVIATLTIVIAGFFVGSDGEVNFSLIGTLFGVTSSVFVSLNSIYTKKVLPLVGDDKWVLAFYNNMNAALMFIPGMLIAGEYSILLSHSYLLVDAWFWFVMTIAGFLGFAIGIVTVMQINLTSPLTHNISGTAKACVQTILALMIWKNPTTPKALIGIFLVIFGSSLYAYVCMQEDRARQAEKAKAAIALSEVKTQLLEDRIERLATEKTKEMEGLSEHGKEVQHDK